MTRMVDAAQEYLDCLVKVANQEGKDKAARVKRGADIIGVQKTLAHFVLR